MLLEPSLSLSPNAKICVVPESDEVFNETSNESALPNAGNNPARIMTATTGNMRFIFISFSSLRNEHAWDVADRAVGRIAKLQTERNCLSHTKRSTRNVGAYKS